MNPWGTMNDWQRVEVEERVRRYGATARRRLRVTGAAPATTRPAPQTTSALSRDDVAACA